VKEQNAAFREFEETQSLEFDKFIKESQKEQQEYISTKTQGR
jgi:hypothetical protein